MAVKQQFIIEIQDAMLFDGEDADTGALSVLLKNREAAEALYADLSEALGHQGQRMETTFLEPYAPAQVPWRPVEIPAPTEAELAELAEFYSEEEPTPIVPVRTEEQLTDAELAASQALTRRQIQAQDPENKASFSPHVASTVPPTEKRGSAIGAIHLPQ